MISSFNLQEINADYGSDTDGVNTANLIDQVIAKIGLMAQYNQTTKKITILKSADLSPTFLHSTLYSSPLAEKYSKWYPEVDEAKHKDRDFQIRFSTRPTSKLYEKIAKLSGEVWVLKKDEDDLALLKDNEETLQLYLSSIHAKTEANQALWEALKNGLFITNEMLVDQIRQAILMGADVNLCSERGELPLHQCYDNFEVFKILLDAGADPLLRSSQGATAFFHCVHIPFFEELFSRISMTPKEVLAMRDDSGCTPLYRVAGNCYRSGGKREVIAYLVQKGADIKAKQTFQDITVLHRITESPSVDIMEEIIAQGADINAKARDPFGKEIETPLYHAFLNENIQGAMLLLKKGAEINEESLNMALGMCIDPWQLSEEQKIDYKSAKNLLHEKLDPSSFSKKALPLLQRLFPNPV